jgi:DNA primase
VLTWSGGANAVAKADFSPLQGRNVIIWPDNDEPGFKAALALAELLSGKAARAY